MRLRFLWFIIILIMQPEEQNAQIGGMAAGGPVLSPAPAPVMQEPAAPPAAEVTIRCANCGAEVIVSAAESANALCHWCRHVLSLNDRVPNGPAPSGVLNFGLTRDQGKAAITKYLTTRRLFAPTQFKRELKIENVLGVYLPYTIIQGTAHASFWGQAEHLARQYKLNDESGKRKQYYDVDLYNVGRNFDVRLREIRVRANNGETNRYAKEIDRIIDEMMPYRIEDAVSWNGAVHLRGVTAEKIKVNLDAFERVVKEKIQTAVRRTIHQSIAKYDRGVAWEIKEIKMDDEEIKTYYLPVWMYSYQTVRRDGKRELSYVAINAQTRQIAGVVPINYPLLYGVAGGFTALGIVLIAMQMNWAWILPLVGLLIAAVTLVRYKGVRVLEKIGVKKKPDLGVKISIEDQNNADQFVRREEKVANERIFGMNDISGMKVGEKGKKG